MKKRIFITIILIMLFTTITIALSFSSKSDDTKQGSEMAIMVQNENNNTQYDEWESETWPDENQYQLNTVKSSCNNTENVTEVLSYNDNNISINTNKTYRCNLYFDKKSQEPLTIVSVDVDSTSANNTVKLIVHATGGDGNYTYSVENTCNDNCYSYNGYVYKGNECTNGGKNPGIVINSNVITITELLSCSTYNNHNFKIKVEDNSGNTAYFERNNISVKGGGMCMSVTC